MSIIVTEHGKKPRRIDQSGFVNESDLQALIHDNPETIPLYEIKEDIQLLVLQREYPTNTGPIDAIGTDKDGDVYVIETKLFKNPDKRKVVAQVLDYGASLWLHGSDFGEFSSEIEASVRDKYGIGLREKLVEFFALDDGGADVLLELVARNLREGRFKFVVPMDQLHDGLKDLIVFLNQNSNFTFYAVEIEHYRLDEMTLLIPKMFGTEMKKPSLRSTAPLKNWTEKEMMEDVRARLSPEEAGAFEKIYLAFKDGAELGHGSTRASFKLHFPSPHGVIPFGEVTAKGFINVYLNSILRAGIDKPSVRKIVDDLTAIDPTFAVAGDLARRYSRAPISAILADGKLQKFIEVVTGFKEGLR